MHEKELQNHEGNIVYCFHRVHKDQEPTRGTRGIIYQGRCYDIQVVAEGKSPIPTIYLPLIETEIIKEIIPLNAKQQNSLERSLRSTLQARQIDRMQITLALKLGESPQDYTGQKTTEEKQEKREESTPMRTEELHLPLWSDLRIAPLPDFP